MMLTESEWLFLNHVIYISHSTENIRDMQKRILELIKLLIPYESATFYLVEHDGSHVLGKAVGVNINAADLHALLSVSAFDLIHCAPKSKFLAGLKSALTPVYWRA